MSKLVSGQTKSGQKLWILTPNARIHSFATNPKKITFLDIFYVFAQILIKHTNRKLPQKQEEAIITARKKILVELDNKVVSLKYLAHECRRQGDLLIARKDYKKKIYDYKPYQVFLTLCESYLDALHSIYDCINEIDKFLGQKFANEIDKKQWFKIDIDLRNVFHHNQSPLLTIEKGRLVFTFELLPRKPRFLKPTMKNAHGRYEFSLNTKDIEKDILNFLNNWAKRYLDLVSKSESIDAIAGFNKDGKYKFKRATLKELINIVAVPPRRMP